MALLRPQPGVQSVGRYYPQQQDPRLNEDLTRAYQLAYSAHDQANQLHGQLQDAHKKLAEAHAKLDAIEARPEPGGPSNTKIGGLNVIGIPPADGQVLTYNAATGQIEWM